jgi:hypothetical protein
VAKRNPAWDLPRPGEGLADADGRVIADTGELHRRFIEAIEADLESEILAHHPGSADELARRAASGGTDRISQVIAAVADELWKQTGCRGFEAAREKLGLGYEEFARYCIARFRTAALLVIGWIAGLCLPAVSVWWVESGTGELVPAPKPRDLVGRRMTTGPPAGVAGIGSVRVIDP